MSKKSKDENNLDEQQLIPREDYEYEKNIALQEQKRLQQEEQKAIEQEQLRKKQQKDAQKEREKRLAKEKLELLQLKNGVIDQSQATIKEEHEQEVKLTGKKWLANMWYHYKYIYLLVLFFVLVIGFITYEEITRERPDLTVMMIADNGLAQRQDELEEFFEKYTDDVDGNGYVHVSVIIIPLNSDSSDYEGQNANSSKFFAQLQAGDCMIVITDSNTEEDHKNIMDPSLDEKFPDNEYIDQLGFSFNSVIMANELRYEYMPNDVHMSIRYPTETMDLSKEESQENYDKSFVVFERIVNDITQKCRETNDPGLETEPVKRVSANSDDSSQNSQEDVSSEQSNSSKKED